jgi:hypothetical protein
MALSEKSVPGTDLPRRKYMTTRKIAGKKM